mgnify:CR=1 FL=1
MRKLPGRTSAFSQISVSPHMENLGSRDGILKAKTEMFAYMNENGTIILNGDDDKLRGYSPENGITPVYFGLDEAAVSREIFPAKV